MKAIRLEFYKCKRRKVLLVCLALIAAQLIWMGVFLARLDERQKACLASFRRFCAGIAG